LDVDPLVRRAAVRVLGNRGPGASIDCVGALLADPDEPVRLAAVEALGELCLRGGDHRRRAAEFLQGALRDGSNNIRDLALYRLAGCREAAIGQADAIRECLDDADPNLQITAAYALGEIGSTDWLEQRVLDLLERHAGGPWDYSLALLLPFLHERGCSVALDRLLASGDASVRFQAECTRARLEGGKGPWSEEAALEERWHTENSEAKEALQRAGWRRVSREEVLARAAQSRLVLCGEAHESEGPIRENLRAVLRAFVKQPAFEAVGFEPSVEDAQSGILELARSLGLRTISLETNWRELNPQGRPGARELEALAAIAGFLGENPKNRMLVLRGESHTLPGGFLVRRLDVNPLVILSGGLVNVPLCVGGLHPGGSAYEVGTTGNVFTLPYELVIGDENAALDKWLAAQEARPR
jgi:hypothetical protein